jgi:hypothetical protein
MRRTSWRHGDRLRLAHKCRAVRLLHQPHRGLEFRGVFPEGVVLKAGEEIGRQHPLQRLCPHRRADVVQARPAQSILTGKATIRWSTNPIASNETARIPIAFANGGDAVALGVVAGIISRPGGNVTGVRFLRVLILDLLGVLVLTWEMELPNARSCRCSSSQKL